MKTSDKILKVLDEEFPNPKCPLIYNKDYELLIAVMLSAQSTDKCVNRVTPILFSKYDIFSLKDADVNDICDIIRPCGNMNKKSKYIKFIATELVDKYDGKVPNDREILESLPGVGRKTTNVVLSTLFNEPYLAVDTHIDRLSKRLGIADESDDVRDVEEKLYTYFDNIESHVKLHHQLLLYGRYICTAKNPKCDNCKLKSYCKFK